MALKMAARFLVQKDTILVYYMSVLVIHDVYLLLSHTHYELPIISSIRAEEKIFMILWALKKTLWIVPKLAVAACFIPKLTRDLRPCHHVLCHCLGFNRCHKTHVQSYIPYVYSIHRFTF